MSPFKAAPVPLRVGVSAVFDPAVTPHARTFLRAMAQGRNLIPALAGVRWHWLDDGADPERAAQVAQQMIGWGADLVIGHFSSDAALAAAPLYRQADIALLTPAATVDRLTEHDNVLRLCPADRQLAADLLAWVAGRGWRCLHVTADGSAHGQALAVAIRSAAGACGLHLASRPEQADAEVFAGRLRPSREHWQARRQAGSTRPLLLTDDAASPYLGGAQAHDRQTWVIGFDDGPPDCPLALQHRQLFGTPLQTYGRESLRLLQVLAALATRPWPQRSALLQALHSETFATAAGPVRFVRGECLGVATRIWQVGPQGLETVWPLDRPVPERVPLWERAPAREEAGTAAASAAPDIPDSRALLAPTTAGCRPPEEGGGPQAPEAAPILWERAPAREEAGAAAASAAPDIPQSRAVLAPTTASCALPTHIAKDGHFMGHQTIQSDALCIGFGPAGIALACVLEDAREQGAALGRLDLRFLEAAADTQWHRELLLDGTDINHHVFRDLVTPRNPRSRFSFAMYLKDKGRMFDFGLLGRPASRHEWSDYVAWVSRQVDSHTDFDTPVLDILPVIDNGRLCQLRVQTPQGEFHTRRLVLSSGSVPSIPQRFESLLGPRVFHTSQFLTRLQAFGSDVPRRWLVIGSGQSASESVLELIARDPQAQVHSVHRSAGFKLTQLGQFPNRVFGPDHVDYFHSLDSAARKQFLDYSRATNYAGIDPDESQKLFSLGYEDAIAGRQRLHTYGYHQVSDVQATGDSYRVTLTDTFSQRSQDIEVDAIVLATGYRQYQVPPLLANLQPWLVTGEDGGLLIDRDYRIATAGECDVQLWVNGLSERSHGISDSQSFSMMALRAERIANALAAVPAICSSNRQAGVASVAALAQ